MKYSRFVAITIALLLSLCVLTPLAVLAEEAPPLDEPYFTTLSNKQLYEAAISYLGDGYKLFQPNPRELDENTSSSSALKDVTVYPLIAVKDQQTSLLVMKKSGGNWEVFICNHAALQRPGFSLADFSVEVTSMVSNPFYVYFDYLDETGNRWTLTLQLSATYQCRFANLSTRAGRKFITLVYNMDRDIDYKLDYSYCRCSYEIAPDPTVSFDADKFSFAQCPIALDDLLKPVDIRNKTISLFMYPDDTQSPVLELSGEESLEINQQENWSLAYYKNSLFYVKTSEISADDE